jgi:hypothetical protein
MLLIVAPVFSKLERERERENASKCDAEALPSPSCHIEPK